MIDNQHYKYQVVDGILHCTFKCKLLNAKITEDLAKSRIELAGERDQYIFVNAKSIGYWPSVSRKKMGSKENQKNLKAIALVMTSRLIIALFNWYLIFFGIETPTKIFKNEKKAMAWLKEQRKIEEEKTVP
jgi:hypothetical protein